MPTAVTPSYTYVSAPYVNLGDLVTVTFQDQAQGRSYRDIRADQIRTKARNVALMEEWAILNGDSTTNALMFDGFSQLITNTIAYAQFAGTNNPLITAISRACREIANEGGLARFVVYSYPVHEALVNEILVRFWQLHQASQAPLGAMGGGINPIKWDFGWGECDLLRSRYLADSGYGSDVYVCDDMTLDAINEPNGNVVQMVDVDPMHAVDLGIIATAWRTVIYETTMLMISCPDFQRRITGVIPVIL